MGGQTIMPPPLSKTSLNSLSRCRGPSNSIPPRSFSTSSSLASIGPENPKFIEIPVPPQHQALPKIDVKGTLPPPRVAEKKARVEAIALAKEEQRRNALHTLYMNARSFITTEEELDAEIEKIFVEDPHASGNLNDNIWSVKGAPPSVLTMLSAVNNTQKKAIDFHRGPAALTGRRMKKIAEELTGGTMD